MAATTKRKRVSKKSKQSWRKHTDIKDVEEYLEEERREERTGGPVSEKPNEGLFFVDKKTGEMQTTEKSEKRSRKRKLLKGDQLLLPESKIKPVGSKQRKVNKNKRQAENPSDSSASEDEEVKSRPAAVKKNNNHKTVATFDLWKTEDFQTGDEHFLRTTRKSKVKKPKTINRNTSELEAVEICVPGASYNPTYEEHQLLLQTAHDVESRKVKEIEKVNRQVRFLTSEEAANLPTWTEEMSQGLFAEDDKDMDEAEKSNGEYEGAPAAAVRAVDRKTKQQRRKEKENQEEQRRLEAEKKDKLRQNEIFRLKTLKKEIKMAEQEAEDRKKKKQEMIKSSAKKPKRLGKHQYESPNIEVQLSAELTGNLRTVKQEGNLFEDRFKSLQRRNIIEARQPVKPHRKYKQKTYKRKSYDKPCIKEI